MAGEHTRARAGVRRRTVLKGAAWSVPVIAAAVAAPAWAAGSGATVIGDLRASACKAADGSMRITVKAYASKAADAAEVDLSGRVMNITASDTGGWDKKSEHWVAKPTAPNKLTRKSQTTAEMTDLGFSAVFNVNVKNGNVDFTFAVPASGNSPAYSTALSIQLNNATPCPA